MDNVQVSQRSRRIARNTVLLYFRMLLLMFVGLFTSRVVLTQLGVDNFGIYTAVGGLVAMFTLLTNAIGSAISRFITCEIGRGDPERLRKVFATSMAIQIVLCVAVVVIAETLGLWFLNCKMDIPADRMHAANWVLQCSTVALVLTLLNAPFYAVILAHEDMKAYAFISILEAVLKLIVAVSLFLSGFDKLITYAILMMAVSLTVRSCYGLYCRKHFPEVKCAPRLEKKLAGEIIGFAGWNALPSGVFLINTQGINILFNLSFGIVANAGRGVANQVEGIVKQFINNVIIAINPQITKSYVTGNKTYSYDLVSKAAKYAYLISLFFAVPFFFEAQTILEIWLKTVPPDAALFTRLAIVCVLLDLLLSAGSTIVLADGRIGRYYAWISSLTVLIMPLSWFAFRIGAPAWTAYAIFICDYVVLDVVKLVLMHRITGYPYGKFFKDVIGKVTVPTIVTVAACIIIVLLLPKATWGRAVLTVTVSSVAICLSSFFFSLTEGERLIILEKMRVKK